MTRQAANTKPGSCRGRLVDRWESVRADVDRLLEELFPPEGSDAPGLVEAMRYSVLGGGKRVRPCVAALAAEFAGGRPEDALAAGAAIEMVHAFSLVHDDLPAMDDDDLRRGRATTHVAFGEATAILVGDALQSLAFEVLAERYAGDVAAALSGELARAIGMSGMTGGQWLDLAAEGRDVTADELKLIHRLKTGALLTSSAVMGGLAVRAGEEDISVLGEYGRSLGLLFQITDDILDETQTAEALGKTPGKDAREHKATYPALFGIDGAVERAREAERAALAAVERAGARGELLAELASYVLGRTN